MRINTKKHLPRRTFLRGVGVSLALPLLDSMIPANTLLANTAANPQLRLGFCYMPHGAVMSNWTPVMDGAGYTLSRTLAPLKSVQDSVLVLTGLGAPERRIARTGRQRRRSWPRSVRVSQRLASEAHRRRRCSRRHDHRSDRRGEDRPGHSPAVARTGDRRYDRPDRRLRRGLQLHLHQYDFVEDADHAAADGDQSAQRVRPPVRRWRHGHRAR